jgi:hypothetical protein
VKSKEMKTGCNLAESSKELYGSKMAVLPVMTMVKEAGCEGEDWVHLAQNRVQWRALVNTVMNLRVPLKGAEFFENFSDCDFQ